MSSTASVDRRKLAHTKKDETSLWKRAAEERVAENTASTANALFTESGRLKNQLQMWWHPPQPALVYSQSQATPNVFFHHQFFLWMPYRMLAFPFLCCQPGCDWRQLSCGHYKTAPRRVIDQVDDYYMGTEYLECGKCHRKVPAWSQEILDQLDICNPLRFPAVLSYHLALDRRVVAELRDGSLSNSDTTLYRKLSELYYHDYMERVPNYRTVLEKFSAQFPAQTAVKMGASAQAGAFCALAAVCVRGGLLHALGRHYVYLRNSVEDELDQARGEEALWPCERGGGGNTAAWVTNVGNEYGQCPSWARDPGCALVRRGPPEAHLGAAEGP
ncbi:hypothetical protein RRG08_008973 [Elysia crispata]|uniref:DUF6729 domain-containing protein n=1 Tax=Elysia crispata TaxID=231223 RepID=A0AAE1AIN5_9GAST|nr:hypothetical protein RRG08_008973 [Elysia crispata]